MSALSIKLVEGSEEDVQRINTLNVLFRMYDIGLTAKYHQTEKGIRRPWRIVYKYERDGRNFRYFETGDLLENFAHKIIREAQANAELSLV